MRTGALLAVALVLAGCADDDGSTSSTIATTAVERSEQEAIRAWLADHRDEMFPGYSGAFTGPCRDGSIEGLCSIPREDLGARSIQGVGVAASDWGADLLLERGADGWSVVDAWGWDLESGAFGPPFSPLTAIAEWWAQVEPDVGFARDCAEVDPSIEDVVCAVVIDTDDETRTYRTGAPPGIDAHVLVLTRQPDDTWAVD